MMTMKTPLAALAILAAGAHFALAEVSTDGIAANLQQNGFTNIEIEVGPTEVKAEGYNPNGTKIEVIYDRATGQIRSQETYRARAGADMTQGVSVQTRSEDFSDDDGEDHDSMDDDHSSDREDDHSGSDHETSDHDSGDHDSGDHDSGDHDTGDHDSGGSDDD